MRKPFINMHRNRKLTQLRPYTGDFAHDIISKKKLGGVGGFDRYLLRLVLKKVT